MTNWSAEIEGDDFDLQELAKLLVSARLALEARPNGTYWLTTTEFDGLRTPDEVRRRASDFLTRVRGAAKLCSYNAGELGVVRIEGKESDGTIWYQGARSVAMSAVVSIDFDDAARNLAASAVTIAGRDKNVVDALAYFTRDINWAFDLYNVFELIRKDVGGQNALEAVGWVSKAELARFTQTTHQLRHAVPKADPPQQPMNESEAVLLIRRLLEGWIGSKPE